MPPEVIEQEPHVDYDDPDAVAPESPEVKAFREKLEHEQAERERLQKERDELQGAMLKSLTEQRAGQTTKPEASNAHDHVESLTQRLMKVGYGEEEAPKMAQILADELAAHGKQFVPREQYEQDSRLNSEVFLDVKTRNEMERLQGDGYAPEDARRVAEEVQKRIREGAHYPSAKAAFNDAMMDLGVAKKSSEGDPTAVARKRKVEGRQRADMHGASRGGGTSDAPIYPPKRLARDKFGDDMGSWLMATDEWVKTLTPEQAARVKWEWQ